jgi:putative oxidoreductase
MKAKTPPTILAAMLIVLFLYTALSKLLDLGQFQTQLANQNIPKWSAGPLAWGIVMSEMMSVLLLATEKYRRWGLYGSALLMLIFSTYMGLVLLDFFDRVPCSCGGVLSSMHFGAHLLFNLFFLAIAILAILLSRKDQGLSTPV